MKIIIILDEDYNLDTLEIEGHGKLDAKKVRSILIQIQGFAAALANRIEDDTH